MAGPQPKGPRQMVRSARLVLALFVVLVIFSACSTDSGESPTTTQPTTATLSAAAVCDQSATSVEGNTVKVANFATQMDIRLTAGHLSGAQTSYVLLFSQLEVIALTSEAWLEECANFAPQRAATIGTLMTDAHAALTELDSVCRTELEPLGFDCIDPPPAPAITIPTPTVATERPAWCVHDDRLQAELALQAELNEQNGDHMPDWPKEDVDRLVRSVDAQGAAAGRLWDAAPATHNWGDVERDCR